MVIPTLAPFKRLMQWPRPVAPEPSVQVAFRFLEVAALAPSARGELASVVELKSFGAAPVVRTASSKASSKKAVSRVLESFQESADWVCLAKPVPISHVVAIARTRFRLILRQLLASDYFNERSK